MKKVAIMMMTVCMVFVLCAFTSATISAPDVSIWDAITSMQVDIVYDGTNSSAKRTLVSKTGTDEIEGTVTVYKQTPEGWQYVTSNTATVSSLIMNVCATFEPEYGVSYKAVFDASVTQDGVSMPGVATAAMPPVAEPQDQTPPTEVYNFLNDSEDYTISKHSYTHTMYTAYSFCGAPGYVLSLTNHTDHDQTIKLRRTSDDKLLESFKIDANSSISYFFSCGNMWYMEIYKGLFQDSICVSGKIIASPLG